jgi:hypothetical protein
MQYGLTASFIAEGRMCEVKCEILNTYNGIILRGFEVRYSVLATSC